MAYFFRTFCCEDGHQFELMMKAEEVPPEQCPVCDAMTDPNPVPGGFNIGTQAGKAGDLAYRQMEKTSAGRAELAGEPSLKITNMKDNLREGEVAAMPVNNAVTQYVEQTSGSFFQGAPMGMPMTDLITAAKVPGSRNGSFGMAAIQQGTVPNIQTGQSPVKGNFGGGF